ncbi:unnamed protein product, partial [Prorocentrum cordatum]
VVSSHLIVIVVLLSTGRVRRAPKWLLWGAVGPSGSHFAALQWPTALRNEHKAGFVLCQTEGLPEPGVLRSPLPAQDSNRPGSSLPLHTRWLPGFPPGGVGMYRCTQVATIVAVGLVVGAQFSVVRVCGGLLGPRLAGAAAVGGVPVLPCRNLPGELELRAERHLDGHIIGSRICHRRLLLDLAHQGRARLVVASPRRGQAQRPSGILGGEFQIRAGLPLGDPFLERVVQACCMGDDLQDCHQRQGYLLGGWATSGWCSAGWFSARVGQRGRAPCRTRRGRSAPPRAGVLTVCRTAPRRGGRAGRSGGG